MQLSRRMMEELFGLQLFTISSCIGTFVEILDKKLVNLFDIVLLNYNQGESLSL
jgi:hypothetical protein